MGVRGGQLAIYFITKISIRPNGSDVRWKPIPQICPTVAKATFQKISTRLRQSQFVITVPKSIVSAERLKYTFQVLRRLIIQSFKHQFQFLFFPSGTKIIPS